MENVPAKNTLLAINVTNALPDFSDFPNAKVVKITNSCPIFILHLFKYLRMWMQRRRSFGQFL